ncbi:MAG: alpha-mannosidase [Abditibacteriota bacterium]|nr:alpha-mannosidase [Abditibacteriota bacterium]
MSLDSTLYALNKSIERAKEDKSAPVQRIMLEIGFAKGFMDALGKSEWSSAIASACDAVSGALDKGCPSSAMVDEAEKILAPIGAEAKKYKVHCLGHAHIDMNWMWSWPETVNNAHDTFYTVDKLMDEFPEAKFGQSQVSLYKAMEDHFPVMAEKIRKRIRSGNWECTASNWVEGEKNNAAGESLARHMLYSRRYLRKYYGLEPEDVKVDWSADIFGHASTRPSIMTKGGVTRYYHSRPYDQPDLFVWKSKDGSELLALRDPGGYSGDIDKSMFDCFCAHIKNNYKFGVRDFMWCYGWGDHGGGPTRAQIRKLIEFREYPILPQVDFSTSNEYYSAIENTVDRAKLPVIEEQRNFVFEGCYTSQANVKFANRTSEAELPSAETLAVLAGAVSGYEYPQARFEEAWQRMLFSQFHDIFPGSGVRATYAYAQHNFQEVMTCTSSVKNQAIRQISGKIDTASLMAKAKAGRIGDDLGAGAAEHGRQMSGYTVMPHPGCNTLAYDSFGATTLGLSGEGAAPILVYNPKPWKRSQTVHAKVWNKQADRNNVFAYDASGSKVKCQHIERCGYNGHYYDDFVFEAKDIPALGYKVYVLDTGDSIEPDPNALTIKSDVGDKFLRGDGQPPMNGEYIIENEYLKVTVDAVSASVVSVIDKETGFNYVKPGERLGLVEYQEETPNNMPAWHLSPVKERRPLADGNFRILRNGPNLITLRAEFKVNKSFVALDTSLAKGSRKVDFTVRTRWFEIGDGQKGIPTLRAYFPTGFAGGKFRYEIPFGFEEREQSAQEIPALKWVSLSDDKHSVTLVNKAKHGHRCQDDTISLTLLRSSYAPDPYPETGDHEIEYSMVFDNKPFDITRAVREGEDFNNPLTLVSAPVQEGPLPAEKSFGSLISGNVNVSAIKKTEDGSGTLIRIYELCGKSGKVQIDVSGICPGAVSAYEADMLERKADESTAVVEKGILSLDLKAWSNATVIIK